MEPVRALRRIAFLLERAMADTYRVQAFRTAADAVAARPDIDAHGPARSRGATIPERARSGADGVDGAVGAAPGQER